MQASLRSIPALSDDLQWLVVAELAHRNYMLRHVQYFARVRNGNLKWGKEEASELADDLTTYKDSEGTCLGNFILERSKGKRTFVVDGQQRLTTVLILLIACRMKARDLGLKKLEPRIQEKITFMNSTTGDSIGCRLIASESIRDLLDYMADVSWDGTFPRSINKKPTKRKVKKIKPIYEVFSKAISSFGPLDLSNFWGALYNSYVARIEVESEIEALSIFERTNARGLDLEISDAERNLHFQLNPKRAGKKISKYRSIAAFASSTEE